MREALVKGKKGRKQLSPTLLDCASNRPYHGFRRHFDE